MSPRRLLGVLLLVPVIATGCGAGLHTETDKERATPYLAGATAGHIAVRAVRVVLSAGSLGVVSPSVAPSPTPSPSPRTSASGSPAGAQGYLSAGIVNQGSRSDALVAVTINGSSQTLDLSLPPQQLIQLGLPDLGITGTTVAIPSSGAPLLLGTTTPVTLTFRDAGTVTVQAPVMTSDDIGTTASAAPVTAGG